MVRDALLPLLQNRFLKKEEQDRKTVGLLHLVSIKIEATETAPVEGNYKIPKFR